MIQHIHPWIQLMLPDLLGDCEYIHNTAFVWSCWDINRYVCLLWAIPQYKAILFFPPLCLHVGNCDIGRNLTMKSYACLLRSVKVRLKSTPQKGMYDYSLKPITVTMFWVWKQIPPVQNKQVQPHWWKPCVHIITDHKILTRSALEKIGPMP